jgi:phosphopantothenoylcysteine decarboxylase/phosphopantothenate--cysteine ligase
MTEAATRFVAPLTFQALTQNPVHSSLWPESTSSESGVAASMAHIDLATSADAILIAPATADFIAKLAHGLADDLLSTLALATRAPVLVAPAMNPAMYEHPATQRNLQTLREYGYQIIQPEVGRMACEHIGPGRLPTTEVLYEALVGAQRAAPLHNTLQGKRVLITAGPTRENLDPVRFISNRSSGKMGYALAAEAAARGAEVLLVSGPTQQNTPRGVARIDVTTTQQMFDAAMQHAPDCDIIIAAAAPADFTPREIAPQKIKKTNLATDGVESTLKLELIPTRDIIATVAKNKKPHQIVIGFAAETSSDIAEAERKHQSKNLDAIVFNDVTQEGAGFDVETNRVTWIDKSTQEAWPLMSKREVAARILDEIQKLVVL